MGAKPPRTPIDDSTTDPARLRGNESAAAFTVRSRGRKTVVTIDELAAIPLFSGLQQAELELSRLSSITPPHVRMPVAD